MQRVLLPSAYRLRSVPTFAGQRTSNKWHSRKTRVAHTSRRTLAGCMRPPNRGADMPNYGTSAPPVTVSHEVSRAEGPWGQTSKCKIREASRANRTTEDRRGSRCRACCSWRVAFSSPLEDWRNSRRSPRPRRRMRPRDLQQTIALSRPNRQFPETGRRSYWMGF